MMRLANHRLRTLRGRLIAVHLSAAITAFPLAAQRTVNLTGTPVAALSEGFTKITGIRELPGNRALVTDRDENLLRLADFSANQLRPVGTKGDGPNEYRLATELIAAPANGAWMTGMGKLYHISGEAKITAVLPQPGSEEGQIFPQTAIGADRAGHLYFTRQKQYGDDSAAIIRWQPQERRVDTVAFVAAPRVQSGTMNAAGKLHLSPGSPKAFDPIDVWIPLPDGRVAGVRGSPYRIDFVDRRRLTHGPLAPFTVRAVTAADREGYNAQRTQIRVASASTEPKPGSSRKGHAPPLDDADFARTLPPFTAATSVRVTPEGEIWVLRTGAASNKTPTYDIFDSSGKLVGKATLKPNSTVVGFGAGTVYVARQDPEDDLRYLEKYTR